MNEHLFDRARREAAAMVHVPPAMYYDEHVLLHRGYEAGRLFACDCGRNYFSKKDRPVSCVRGLCK